MTAEEVGAGPATRANSSFRRIILAGRRTPLHQFAVCLVNIVAPENKDHFFDLVLVREEFWRGFYSDLCGLLDRIAVRAAADGRKRYRLDSGFHRCLYCMS